MGTKMIKDPVHGYIKIHNDYMKDIIDSCEFQRLRNIRQTSYDSLYPGSSHSRFIHSLGVYYLGSKVFTAFRRNVEEQERMKSKAKNLNWESLKHTFELACLLHDVGHTPFSHTGEDFLLFEKEVDKFEIMKGILRQKEQPTICALYNNLLTTLEDSLSEKAFADILEDFAKTVEGSKSYISGKKVANPHEIMSVIVSIATYGKYFEKEKVDIDLFARMILGICYNDLSNFKTGVKNALIQLLNSSIIDVDRLDYIIRDTQMSGFDSTSIDIERLLESVTLIHDQQKCIYCMGYKKNALSTIVNVVLAHDAERRWIQAHPIVMYDSFLIKKCINAVEKEFKAKEDSKSIFQQKAFTTQGIQLENGLVLRLMNDGDFIFLMKQIKEDNPMRYYVDEYLSRDKRRSPIWKSEAEFRLLLNELTKAQRKILMDTFAAEGEKNAGNSIGSTLNRERIKELEEEIRKMEGDADADDEDLQNTIMNRKRQLFWLEKLKDFFSKINKDSDFNIYNQKTDVFRSKINSLSALGVEIWYDQFQKAESIKDVLSLYNTDEDTEEKKTKNGDSIRLFYFYIEKNEMFKIEDFIKFLKDTLEEYENEFIKE